MNGKDGRISVEVESLRREFESKQNKVVALDGVNLRLDKARFSGWASVSRDWAGGLPLGGGEG